MITKKERLQNILKEANLKVTPQRIEFLSIAKDSKNHPTLFEIWMFLKDIFPGISRTTVYNIVDIFLEKGILKQLSIDNKIFIDFNVSPHGHFVCRECNKIFDINMENIKIDYSLKEFLVEKVDIIFKGICKNCRKEVKKMEDKKKLVLEIFEKAGKPLRPGDVAKEAGIDSKEVSKIIKELRKEGKIDSPKRCYYAPVK